MDLRVVRDRIAVPKREDTQHDLFTKKGLCRVVKAYVDAEERRVYFLRLLREKTSSEKLREKAAADVDESRSVL